MPTSDLAAYLDSEYEATRRRIVQINELLLGVAILLCESRGTKPPVWPYSWKEGSQRRNDGGSDFSMSTQAMCCTAVELLLAADARDRFFAVKDVRTTLERLVLETTQYILNDMTGKLSTGQPAWKSETYLGEDVFTASWLVELYRVSRGTERAAKITWPEDVKKRIVSVISQAVTEQRTGVSNEKGEAAVVWWPNIDRSLFPDPAHNEASAHPLPLLRAVRAIQALREYSKADPPSWPEDIRLDKSVTQEAGRWFERNLNRQMSFYHFKDFRFDAAELIFCLAGALDTVTVTPQEPTLGNVLEIIRGAQERSVYWRPYRPMLSTSKGAVLLPLSIEVASALLYTLSFLSKSELVNGQASKFHAFKDTLDKYYIWLVTQCVRFGIGSYIGWHSENAYETEVVHVWDSALVSAFLAAFRSALEEDIRAELLKRFSVRKLGEKDKSLTELLPFAFDLGISESLKTKSSLEVIRDECVKPLVSGAEKRIYSMLFYGPPGVSKTTLAAAIAKELQQSDPSWEFVYLSPSDFITSGEAAIEERAKNIFRGLNGLRTCVIFFDEIDRMILDRESTAYGEQGDMFQFMTPGMLTKLNELRKEEQSIFVIATNFAERIDPAIKREGRIDRPFLCLPYDLKSRTGQLKKLIEQESKNDAAWDFALETTLQSIAMKVALYVYEELKRLVGKAADAVRTRGTATGDLRAEIVKHLDDNKNAAPSPQISIKSYVERVHPKRRSRSPLYPQKPFEECVRLMLIRGESASAEQKEDQRNSFSEIVKLWQDKDPDNYAAKVGGLTEIASAHGLGEWFESKR